MPIISCASQEALKYHRMKRDASQASLHADEPPLSGPRLSGPHDEVSHQNLLFLQKIEQRKLLEDYRTKTHTGKSTSPNFIRYESYHLFLITKMQKLILYILHKAT